MDANGQDAKTVLSTLTVESLIPNVYTIVEVVDSANIEHCQRAHADEIVVGSEFSSTLLYRAAVDHGFSKILSGLLSSRFGNGLYRMPVPASMAGNTFMEVFTQMKRSHQSTVLAVIQGTEGKIITNPPADIRVEGSDHLSVIASGQPR
ncbi:hypothetical protein MYX65_07910 [Acidobacteria bacterium AH-259-L09]|nr:hypothetical protein [Acidobacteria bacterium AH-259-L09]